MLLLCTLGSHFRFAFRAALMKELSDESARLTEENKTLTERCEANCSAKMGSVTATFIIAAHFNCHGEILLGKLHGILNRNNPSRPLQGT